MISQEPQMDEIHLGDCLQYLKSIPSDSVHLVLSSPPYNIGRGKETRKNLDDYMKSQSDVLRECFRVLNSTGSLFWQVGSYTRSGSHYPLDILYFPLLENLGMIPRNRIIWPRAHGVHARKRFSCRHESILWFTKTDDYKFFLDPIRIPQLYPNKKAWKGPKKGKITSNPLGKNPGDVWLFENVKHNHEEQTIHPAQFPELLVERIVLATTEPKDIVLDPYMGVGTTALVVKRLGRHFLGVEVEREYWDVARRRLSGEPEDNSFVNLKQLREFALNHNLEDISQFSFDAQTSKKPSMGKTDLNETLKRKEILWQMLALVFGTEDATSGLPQLDDLLLALFGNNINGDEE